MLKIDGTMSRSVLAGLLLWAAFPPLNWWPLAAVSVSIYLTWIYPSEKLTRRDYFAIWIGASLCWLALLQGIRLAFWPLYAGWIALSLYLAIYTVAFVGLSRVLVHRWRWPIVIATPLAWISLELARGYIITGFSSCLLGHVVASHPTLIQIAAHLGAYGISASVVLAAFVLFLMLDHGRTIGFNTKSHSGASIVLYSLHRWQLLGACVVLAAVVGFGVWEVSRNKAISENNPPLFSALLIQENAPTIFDLDPESNFRRNDLSWDNYLEQTRIAAKATSKIDLIVWPESAFTRNEPVFEWNGSATLPARLIEDKVDVMQLERVVQSFQSALEDRVTRLYETVKFATDDASHPYFLLGNDMIRIQGADYDQFNAALWLGPDRTIKDYYAKQHRVMFGEYIPFAEYFPILNRIPGVPRLSAGEKSVCFDLDGKASIIPSICFENVLPHFLHRQILSAEMRSISPDVMVNITNDGWFRGSSISDHHLANATLASVENRRPMLVAANTGLSAWIDGGGKRISVTQRLQAGYIHAEPKRDGRWGLWQAIGDWPIRVIAGVCFILWLWPTTRKKRDH
ncbi:MAG: apolipoprotein N-acyltransferase [Pirellulaceae bacterium]|nr:apolipoprotein N-acyltransferase [Pirellulaceae bacterium]